MVRLFSFLTLTCIIFWFLFFMFHFNPLSGFSTSLFVLVTEEDKSRRLEAKWASIQELRRSLKKIDNNLTHYHITLLEAAVLYRESWACDPILKDGQKNILAWKYPGLSYEEGLCRYLIWKLGKNPDNEVVYQFLQAELEDELSKGPIQLPAWMDKKTGL